MELDSAQLDALESFCRDNDYKLRKDYSGRCMFGDSCIGIVSDENPFSIAMKMVEASEYDDDFPLDIFKDAGSRQDSMGMSRIVYFPGISAPFEEEVECM